MSLWLLVEGRDGAAGPLAQALDGEVRVSGTSCCATCQSVPAFFLAHHLKCGDALIGRANHPIPPGMTPFDWATEFPEVFARENPGFDAVLGNPPWVSYVGRAAQPLDSALKGYYSEVYESFHGYRNLESLFVERGVKLARAGGRVGLVLPSSMTELEGYALTRAVHDRLAEPDPGWAGSMSDCGRRRNGSRCDCSSAKRHGYQ